MSTKYRNCNNEEGQKSQEGPDQILDSNAYTATAINDTVRLRVGDDKSLLSGCKPISIPGLLKLVAKEAKDSPALSVKRDGQWQTWTYSEYLESVEIVAKAYIALGLQARRSVAVMGFNSPEWFFADIGAIFAGGVSVGIYPTNSADATQYVIEHSGADIVVVEGDKELAKILPIREQLKGIKAIVQYLGTPSAEGVLSWFEFMALGEKQSCEKLNERLRQVAINQCCHLVYTSGTTGPPKAVMLSHDNLIYGAKIVLGTFVLEKKKETYISYLPLSHVAANVTDIYVMMNSMSHVYFAEKDALKGSLINTVKEVRPTRFFGVPRVWEKIAEGLQEIGRQNKGMKKMLGDWAKKTGLDYNKKLLENEAPGLSINYMLAQRLVFSKIRIGLGLDKSVGFWAAAAPVSEDTHEYFLSLDMRILEIYGMSECSGPQMANTISHQKIGSIGKTFYGAETKMDYETARQLCIKSSNSLEDDKRPGEICMRGRHVMMGYLNDRDRTEQAIDGDGWLHSGDVANIDSRGFYILSGRIKEILVTAGGENVAPLPIEDEIKKELPCLSQAMVVGDRRKFLCCVLAFKTLSDPNTELPLEELTSTAIEWGRKVAKTELQSVQQILEGNTQVMSAIQSALDKVNKKAVSNAQKVQKFIIAKRDFSTAGGELGPTLKLKRNVVLDMYKKEIDALYYVEGKK